MSDEFHGLDATEKARIGAALNRCRALAGKIANELRNKKPEHFVEKSSLAEIHSSLERAADVLGRVKRAQAQSPIVSDTQERAGKPPLGSVERR